VSGRLIPTLLNPNKINISPKTVSVTHHTKIITFAF